MMGHLPSQAGGNLPMRDHATLICWIVIIALALWYWHYVKSSNAKWQAEFDARQKAAQADIERMEHDRKNGSKDGVCGPADGVNCNSTVGPPSAPNATAP
jgi:hypothetical protein